MKKIINLSSDKWDTIMIVVIVVYSIVALPIYINSQSADGVVVLSSVSEVINFLLPLVMCISPVIIVLAGIATWKQYRERNIGD